MLNCDLWPVPEADTCVNGCTIPEDTNEDLLESASILAGNILRTLSGNRVGLCVDTVRPISECSTCRGTCRCADSGDRIRLFTAAGPISSVGEVLIDGDILDTADYRFYPSAQLLYRRPPGTWPVLDRKWAECGDPDTMCVQVVVGNAPDAWALSVHTELVCELLKSCTDDECRIPRNATQVTGQGISITLSPTELKQFIPSVAGWVAAVNPHNAQQPSKVWSPDLVPQGVQGAGVPGGDVGPLPPWPIGPPWDIEEGGP